MTDSLTGRRSEVAALDRVLEDARSGRSGVLVLRGEPGVGKSALLAHALSGASQFRVVRAVGVESEMELPFAGLHQLCAPMLDRLARLPDPQRDALGTAFGLIPGARPERFLIGLAMLGLLSDVASDRPLVCVVDDAQWIDRASLETLSFVARRVFAESVALLFATREAEDELSGQPELVVEGLRKPDARQLLDTVVTGPVDERVRDRILAETRGNPLALLELSRGRALDLAGGFAPSEAPLSGRIEASFLERLDALPPDTRRLVLAAAADPVGDAALLWRAADRLGIGTDAGAPAEAAGLFSLRSRVTFSHPLVRSAVYRAATPAERREVHRALAEATDPQLDPDRRAWHRAEAAAEPDEEVAAELERSAERARARGGLAAAAAFLERSAGLTVAPERRTERALAAAQAKHEAGAADAAFELLALVELGPVSELQRARAERLRAAIAFAQRRGSDAPPLLLQAARRLHPLDPALARETYVEALAAAVSAGHRETVVQAGQALRAAPPQPARALELLVTGEALMVTDGRVAAIPMLERALRAFRSEALSDEDELHGLPYAVHVALSLWDDESWHVLAARHVQLAREAGALATLPAALDMHAVCQVSAGDFGRAQALLGEADAVSSAAGSVPLDDGPLFLTGWRGVETVAQARIEDGIRDATDRGEESTVTVAEYARAVLSNALGRHEEALAAAQRSSEHHPAKAYRGALIELIEAASRSGRPQLAEEAFELIREETTISGTDWALGIAGRSSALLADGEEAERGYREAIDRLSRTRLRVELARTHLLYGEWLRRERRRVDAREQLRLAHELFAGMGAEAFASRAARELLATGETARKRSTDTSGHLTAQEAQIARLARDGLSNPEIAARLFISPRTVEYHLHKVFTKLDITSRNQLGQVLPEERQEVRPAS